MVPCYIIGRCPVGLMSYSYPWVRASCKKHAWKVTEKNHQKLLKVYKTPIWSKKKECSSTWCELDRSGNSWGISLTLTLVLGRDWLALDQPHVSYVLVLSLKSGHLSLSHQDPGEKSITLPVAFIRWMHILVHYSLCKSPYRLILSHTDQCCLRQLALGKCKSGVNKGCSLSGCLGPGWTKALSHWTLLRRKEGNLSKA